MNFNNIPSILTYSGMGVAGLGVLYSASRLNKILRARKFCIELMDSLDSMHGVENAFYSGIMSRRLNKDKEVGIELNSKKPIALWVPHNIGIPSYPVNFYKNGEVVLSNRDDFTEIQNLPQLLHQITDIMVEAYDSKIPIFSTRNFGLGLIDELVKDYLGNAKLVYLCMAHPHEPQEDEIDVATTYCANEFLDVFMGWNYGDFIRADSTLEEKLQGLNTKLLIDGNRRNKKLTGFDVSFRNAKMSPDNHYDFAIAS